MRNIKTIGVLMLLVTPSISFAATSGNPFDKTPPERMAPPSTQQRIVDEPNKVELTEEEQVEMTTGLERELRENARNIKLSSVDGEEITSEIRVTINGSTVEYNTKDNAYVVIKNNNGEG